jgi:tetratricopeptide (TPR) repeat protein
MVAQIVQSLTPQVREAELKRIRAQRPSDFAAYHLVLQARDRMYQLDRSEFEGAQQFFSQAFESDPAYATSYALAAEWHSLRVGQGWSPNISEDVQAVDRFAEAAIARNANNARALAFRGHNRSFLNRDYEAALTLFDQALSAGPNDASAWGWSSPTHSYLEDGDAAIRRAQRALQLSPFDPFAFQYQHFVSIGYYTKGSYQEAAQWGLRAMRAQPNYTSNLRFTAAALVASGRIEEAKALGRRIMSVEPNFSVGRLVARHPYRDPARRVQIGKQLRAAGLPE